MRQWIRAGVDCLHRLALSCQPTLPQTMHGQPLQPLPENECFQQRMDMSQAVTLYNVFIASPNDVAWARAQIRQTVHA